MKLTDYHAKYFAYELTRRFPPDSAEKLAAQKTIRAIEAQRNQKRRSLFDAQDQVDKQRDELIVQIEGKLQQHLGSQTLFQLRWRLN